MTGPHKPLNPGRSLGASAPPLRVRGVWPVWFGPLSGLIAASAVAGADQATLLLAVIVVALVSSRDMWQVVLTLLMGSLTLATAPRGVAEQLPQPFLLRFIIASSLIALTLTMFRLERRGPVAFRVHSRALGLFFVAAVAGILFSEFPRTAIEGVLGTAVILGVPVVASRRRWRHLGLLVADLGCVHRFLWLVTVAGLGIAASTGFVGRAGGLHFNPNTYAFMCLLGFGLDLGLRRRLPWWALPLTAPVFLAGVLATGSRGALLGVLLAPAYLLLRRRARNRTARITAAMLVGFAILLMAPLPEPFGLGGVIDRTFGGESVDLSGRQEAWDNMAVLFGQRPVLGHGLRTTNEALGDAQMLGQVGAIGGHSSYLQVLVETGVLGAVPLFGAIALALRLPAPAGRDALTAWVAASGVVVAGLGHMVGESFVLGVGSPFPLVFWTGVTVLALVGSQGRRIGGTHPHA